MAVPLMRLPWPLGTLRRGDTGEAVRWLQERLREQGYEVGPVDGKYGFLTEDAVMSFQRDRRLRVDGVAGPQVMAALRENPPRQRLLHVVEEGERLHEIAARYGVSVEALRWMNRLSPRARLVPGRRLVVWSTYVLAGLSPRAPRAVVERTLALSAGRATGVVDFARAVRASGELEGPPGGEAGPMAGGERFEAFLGLREGDGSELVAAVMRRASRRRLAAEVKAAVSTGRAAGVFVDPGPLPYGEGTRYLKTLAQLRRAAGGLKLAAAIPVPASGWKGLAWQFDYEAAGRLIDLAVLPFHRWESLWRHGDLLPWDVIEAAVARATRRLPPWRLLLGVPLGACVRAGYTLQELPYRAAVIEGYAARRRLAPSSGGFLAMELAAEEGRAKEGRAKEAPRRFLAQGRDAFARFLALAYRYRLAGVYLFPLAEEDARLWTVLHSRIKVMDAPNITSSPGAYTSYNQSEGE